VFLKRVEIKEYWKDQSTFIYRQYSKPGNIKKFILLKMDENGY